MSEGSEGPRSGLRNPAAAVRGAGAAGLAVEGLVMLLAIVPIRVLGGNLSGTAIAVVIALAVACFVLAGLLRRAWAWYAAAALQVVLLVAGLFLNTALAILGVLFGLVWGYVLYVRHTVLFRPRSR